MACDDTTYHHWHLVTGDAHYELSVTGPAGFTAYASYDEAGPPGAIQWNDISPGPRIQLLKGPGGTHVVRTYVEIVSVAAITVRVTAKITPAGSSTSKDYCSEVTGANGKTEIITHSITMK